MGGVIATLEGALSAFHGLDKAGFFLEIARQHILYQVVGIPALLGGRVRERASVAAAVQSRKGPNRDPQ
jgi:hypothetical protein